MHQHAFTLPKDRKPLVCAGMLSRRAVRRADVRLFWHPQGDYLAVQVDRFTKTRKSTYTSFELFSVKERDIPMEARHIVKRACSV